MAKRSKSPQFRCTPEEDAHLRKAAEDAGMGFSDYLRALTLNPTVVVVDGLDVVLIPSTVTLAEADEHLQGVFGEVLEILNNRGREASPAPAAREAPPDAPAGAFAEAPAAPAPGSPPPHHASPEPAGMVGASAPASGEGSSVAAVSQQERCPHCGGTEGRHQGFCEVLTGEPAVPPAEQESAPPGQESMNDYVARRMGEGEHQVVAEAEWRQGHQAPPPADPSHREACPNCGALKRPDAACADCGRRPG